MNGGIILGTLDGVNIEIMEEIGRENMFIFGSTAEEIQNAREQSATAEPINEHLYCVLKSISSFFWADSHVTNTEFLPLIKDRMCISLQITFFFVMDTRDLRF